MEKGLSPIVGVILVLLIAISLTVLAIVWLPKFTFQLFPQMGFNESYMRSQGCLSIEDVKGLFGFFTIKNCGKIALSSFKFFLDGGFVSNLNIGTLEPSQTSSFYDMPIPGGKHEIYITADYAESPSYKLNVPYWECIGGEPILVDDWYVSRVISCICSYNTKIPIDDLFVIENGSLSLYNCILWLGRGTDSMVYIRDNGFLNLTRSKITKPSSNWGEVYFEDNSTIYLLNSTVNDPSPIIQDETKVTAINSNLGSPRLVSNMLHNLSIPNFYCYPPCSGSDSPVTKYIKADGSNLTINFTNVSFDEVTFTIRDNSNTTFNNVTSDNFQIYSEYPHNLTIRNWGCTSGCGRFNNYFKAEGSNFTLNGTNFYPGWTYFYANGGSNNTIIDSCIGQIMIDSYHNSTNRFINFSSGGWWYLYGMNYTMNFTNSTLYGDEHDIVFSGRCSGCIAQAIWNFSNTTVRNNICLHFQYGNITFFGNVSFIENTHVGEFYGPDDVNVTRYFPTIIKDSYNYPFPTIQPANISIKNINNQTIWQASVSSGSIPIQYYIEDPKILFNTNNYDPGNFFINVSQVCENISRIHLLNSTPLEFTLQRAFNYSGSSFNTQTARGLAFDNTNFWVAASNGNVSKYTPTGTFVSFFLSGLNGLRDVASNGTYLWLLNYNSSDKRVYRYLPTGIYNNSYFDIDGGGAVVTEPYAIDFDGENFWVLGNTSVYKYNSAGGYTSFSFNLDRLSGMYFGDIVAFNRKIWILTENYSTSKGRGVFRYKTDGVYDNWYFDIAPTTNEGRGLAYNGTYFWIMNSTGTVFRYNLTKNCLEVMKQCDEFITFLPYTINKNNTRYCLLYDLYILNQKAIIFSSIIRNTTLDCLNYNINGNNVSNTYGVYLNGTNTRNNTIKNCSISNFESGIYIKDSNDNNLINNTAFGNINYGIFLNGTSANQLISNTAYNNSKGILLYGTYSLTNDLINNYVYNNVDGIWFFGAGSPRVLNNYIYNNNRGISIWEGYAVNVTGGSIHSNLIDYSLGEWATDNNFTDTNFTSARKIELIQVGLTPRFNYNNQTTGNIWLKTNLSSSANITRKLISWNQTLIQWNDSSDVAVTARYNVTGLTPGASYRIYNNSFEISGSPFKADSSGTLSFTIYLPLGQEREIKVKAVCDYYIFSSDIPYTISQNNKLYCLVTDVIDSSAATAIRFASGAQNSAIDCLNHVLDGVYASSTIGIYSNQYNTTVKNCKFNDWDNPIYYENLTNGLIYNNSIIGNSIHYAVTVKGSSNVQIVNLTDNTSTYYGIDITNSNNTVLTNMTVDNLQHSLWITNCINTQVSNSTFITKTDDVIHIWPALWVTLDYCNQRFTNVMGKNNKPIVFYNNTNAIIRNWNNNFSEIIMCNADNSIIDNVTMVDNYGMTLIDSDANITNIRASNFSSFMNPIYLQWGSHNLTNVSAENISGTAIYLWQGTNNVFVNITARNSGVGLYFKFESDNNQIINSSIYNNIYDFYLANTAGDRINFTNTNFTGPRTIYFEGSVQWFNYRNDTINNLWLKTRTSRATTITRKLTTWSNTLMQWKDNSSSSTTATATYNITGLIPITCYNVYNNSALIYNLYSGSNGEISFTIALPANQERNITVNSMSCNVLNFSFNEGSGTTAYDTSPFHNDGTLVNNPSWVPGKYGNALSFNGINNYVQIPWSDSFNIIDQITIAAWVYPKSLSGYTNIFEKYDWSASYKLGFYNNRSLFTLYGSWDSYSIGTVSLDTWSYIAATYDRQNVRIYINGVLDTTIPHTDQIGTQMSTLYVGSRAGNDNFNGTIDELRVWRRILSQLEIQAEMNKG